MRGGAMLNKIYIDLNYFLNLSKLYENKKQVDYIL
jgi:hypothetical protein